MHDKTLRNSFNLLCNCAAVNCMSKAKERKENKGKQRKSQNVNKAWSAGGN